MPSGCPEQEHELFWRTLFDLTATSSVQLTILRLCAYALT
jgi:hypothetical protein